MKKKILVSSIGITLVVLLTATVAAQDQKIGYVNTDLIIQKMSGYEGMKQQLRSLSQKWKAELEQMKNEIEQLKEEFEAKKILYTEQVRKQKQQQIQQKIKRRKQFMKEKFGPGGAYFQKQKELLKPIQRKIYEAIIAVSQRLEIDFVFDRAKNNSLLFARKEWNLNEEILSELGITLSQ